ncbi:hypothetical protein SISNIDRAFT_471804 [Sistotremastrum niveocremeum HHB9708]|uniref:DNA2/NAM7 helicase helicase domain-containing protein n=1 Tax=Sistotremastrum niveocremeum HHB9708 TaxID=1314777 RepID=A0A164M6W0_9AGAM|nr:hypothetical protein SISNIDRAFT_471804 [Sistotremastrum niveocremeum HHB9708]
MLFQTPNPHFLRSYNTSSDSLLPWPATDGWSALSDATLFKSSCKTVGFFQAVDLTAREWFHVIVSTCISASLPFAVGLNRDHFTPIIVDEASQALTYSKKFGDQEQLGPLVRSTVAIKWGLAQSYLVKSMEPPSYDEKGYRGVSTVKSSLPERMRLQEI